MIEVKKFSTDDKYQTSLAFDIRDKVFVIEQEVDKSEEYDEFEDDSTHFLIYEDGKAIGTARWRKTKYGFKLERFAVLKDFRGSGKGLEILKAVINDLPETNEPIYLHAQVQVVGFYQKVGFKKVGEQFEEANIQHYKMILG